MLVWPVLKGEANERFLFVPLGVLNSFIFFAIRKSAIFIMVVNIYLDSSVSADIVELLLELFCSFIYSYIHYTVLMSKVFTETKSSCVIMTGI